MTAVCVGEPCAVRPMRVVRRTWTFALVVVGLLMSRVLCAYTALVTVYDGETYELAAADDKADNMITLEAGATLLLPSATLNAYLRVTGGEATLTGPDGAETITLVGGLREMENGALKVENAKRLAVGKAMTDIAYWPMFDAESVSFTAQDATGIVFTNRVFVRKAPDPSATPMSVAPDAYLAFWAEAPLQRVSGQEDLTSFTLEGWNLMQMANGVFPTNTTITVKGKSAYILKPCTVGEDNNWAGVWSSNSGTPPEGVSNFARFTNVTNVVLASDATGRARVMTYAIRELDIPFSITGTGDFRQEGGFGGFKTERINFFGDLTFDGTITATGENAGFVFKTASLTNWQHAIYLNANGNRLQYWGGVPSVKNRELYLHEIHCAPTATWFLQSGQTWRIGNLYGKVTLGGQGSEHCVVQVDHLDAAATAYATGGCALKLIAADDGAEIRVSQYDVYPTAILDLSAFSGTSVPPIYLNSSVALKVVGGAGLTLNTFGEGAICAPDVDEIVSEGAVLRCDVPAETSATIRPQLGWQAKVAQWYDASETNTLGGYPKNGNGTAALYTNDYPIICSWSDRRAGVSGVKLYNGRSFDGAVKDASVFKDRHDEVNPFVVKGGLNGLDYVSCGTYQTQIPAKWRNNGNDGGTVTEARRLHMVATNTFGGATGPGVNPTFAYAILVFGSAQGGGAAILAGNGAYARGTTLNDPFFLSGDWPMYVDGVATNGATARPNGGWQILSIPLGNKVVNGIGWKDAFNNSGGQDYAEILLFATAPTDKERRACEEYLAAKWGLRGSYPGGLKTAPRLNVNGGGAVTLAADAELTGGFVGTVTVPSNVTLVVQGDAPSPPTEAVVPTENRLIWFDPDLTNAYESTTPAKPLSVSKLWPRTENGLVTGGNAMSGLSGTDRRPWANRSARGDGVERTWLDFGNAYTGDNQGNTLRHQTTWGDNTSSASMGNVREGFMVLDTSRGGGTPIGIDVNCSKTRRANGGTNASSAIWPNNEGVFTNVVTRLDDTKVDGKMCGFNGRPEVLEFSFSTPWTPAFFGYYGDGVTTNGNAEIIGESIFYSEPLSDEKRHEVTAYLMYKWFGKVLDGYTDLSRMTVTGAGTVSVASMDKLPILGEGFTGKVALAATACVFTIDATIDRKAATNAVTVAHALELPDRVAISVEVVGTALPGLYKLIEGVPLTGATTVTPQITGAGDLKVKLVRDGNVISLRLGDSGTMVIVR